MAQPKNLFQRIPSSIKTEAFESILHTKHLKLERIISKGHTTPTGQWYYQKKNEWVLLMKGSADIRIEGQQDLITLQAGDYLLLPAHLKHRVERTDADTETVWLALHF